MYYWNKDNFEGLLQIAQQLEADEHLKPLAAYCRFREQGLRREAFRALDLYLEASRSFDSATARLAATQILEANALAPSVHHFLAQPLIKRFLLPTLQAWMQEDAGTNVPVRWLGILNRDRELLARALSLCPDDVPVRKQLIDFALGDVDFATHHLDESHFIGSVEVAAAALELARTLIANAPDPEMFARYSADARHLDCLLEDWRAYSKNPVGTFPEWCAARGHDYNYPVKVYYAP
ncbi:MULTISPECIES: hypothetical protein [unclassified Achromobacter]|uniref:hypothetical protein n=1 Tax=unclassified Achromobacter TaxID=2626865 RepID=UPI000B516511|nr:MULTISPECIES: hypothetical protein [unclassified Achromobacter]OWT81122.1 hypothetical protein CEY05_04155 [Achromobacter sp. HZ34]OWT82623.1 hypothetical protein CEY04_04150 [Achromobacter sp. HZ28]